MRPLLQPALKAGATPAAQPQLLHLHAHKSKEENVLLCRETLDEVRHELQVSSLSITITMTATL